MQEAQFRDRWSVCCTQYTLMRTPAELFFPAPLQRSLEDALRGFGEARLGCGGVSQVWLAYYVDGMRQVRRREGY